VNPLPIAVFSLAKIEIFIQPELVQLTLGLSIISWIIYKVLLKDILPERHRNLKVLFKNLSVHVLIFACFFGGYSALKGFTEHSHTFERMAIYLGYLTLIWALVCIVKSTRILLFEYLFLSHMRVGVPVLIVNIYTLLVSFGLLFWVATSVFEMRLTPLVATSAFLSLVIGLALQDTLGNLFAGVSLQFDKPFEIGDWIEVQNGPQKLIGEVREVSWRATLLLGFAEELVTIPNRLITQSEISNWSGKAGPVIRSQVLRIPYGVDIEKAKEAMLRCVTNIAGVRIIPSPQVLIVESTDSWLTFKLIYYIDNYGQQYVIGDKVLTRLMSELSKAGIQLASNRLAISK
jgi:small-conductance mechanosensitive channel